MKKLMIASMASLAIAGASAAQERTPAPFCDNGEIHSKSQAIMALTMMRSNLDVCSTIGGTACDVVITDMKMWVQDGQMECVLSWLENAAASSDNSASTLQVADMADAYTGQMTQFLKFIKSR